MSLPYVPYRKSSHIIELGYIEKSPHWRLDSRFFPSKVGGKPAWLDLTALPSDLTCKKCKKPCVFLLQLYAPLQSKDSCFHRSFFVFVCKDPLCCRKNSNKNFRVYRSQIPRMNPYYEYTPPIENPSWNDKFSVSNWCRICEVCGANAGHVCGKCRAVYYCCRLHQQIAWKSGHKRVCGKGRDASPDNTGFLLPEYEIYCEPEDQDDRYEASAVVEGRRTRKKNNVEPSVSMNGSKPAAKKSDTETVAVTNGTENVAITNGTENVAITNGTENVAITNGTENVAITNGTKTVVSKTGTEAVGNEIDVKTIGNEKDVRTVLSENGMVPTAKTNGVETLLNGSRTEPTVNANGLKPVVNGIGVSGAGNEPVVNENGMGRRTRKKKNVEPSVSMNGSKPAAKKSDTETVAVTNGTENVAITNGTENFAITNGTENVAITNGTENVAITNGTKTVVSKTGTEAVGNEIDVKTIGNEKDVRTVLNENSMVPTVKTNGVETLLNDSETEPTVNANGLKPFVNGFDVNGAGNEPVVNESDVGSLENKVGTGPLENGSGLVTEPVLNKNDTAGIMKNATQPEAEISNLHDPLQSDKTGNALELKDQKTCEEEPGVMSKTEAIDNTEEKSEDDQAEMQGAKKKTRKRNRRRRGRKKKAEDHVDDIPDVRDELDENDRIQMNELQKVIDENPGILQENLNAEELEKYAKVETDQQFRKFQERVRRHPTQVLRYCINSEEGPLWVSGENIMLVKDVPRCEKCNAVRVYEFQIMPQLLNFLGLDSKEASIDWGTLVIYSCSASCDGAPSYKEEFLYKQDFSEK